MSVYPENDAYQMTPTHKTLFRKRAITEPDEALDYVSANGKYWDQVSGKELEAEWVIKARLEEMDEFRKHEVYRKVPREECMKNNGRALTKVRWLDINKGDEKNPDYRSRLVAQALLSRK